MQLREVIVNEIRYLFHGRCPIVLIIFLLPLFFTIMFGMAYEKNVVNNIPTVVYDQDQNSMSRKLTQAYNDSEKFKVIAYVDNREDMEAMLRSGKALAGIEIPIDFTKKILAGNTVNVMLLINSDNNIFSNAAIGAARDINKTLSVSAGQKLMEARGVLPSASMNMVYPIRLGIRIMNNPVNGYNPFVLSGLMLNGLQISLILVAAPLLVDEYEKKRYGRKYRSIALLIGKTIPCWLVAIVSYLISLTVLEQVFDIPCRGEFYKILLLGMAFSFMVIQIMLLFSSISASRVLSMEMPLLYVMPGLLYSGISWPQFAMNKFALFFSSLLPMTYVTDNLRDLLLAGYAPNLWHDIFIMMISGIFIGSAALIIFKLRRRHLYE